jgi:ParB family chromosome partitioning protein
VGRRSGLGKGLGALIPAAPEVGLDPDSPLRDLPIERVRPNRYQPRDHFDDEALAGLTASVAELGVLQPVLVRPVDDHFELIAGERRWRAAREAGLETIPALIREVDDNSSLEQALVENLHREDLSALEEAAAFQQLMDEFSLSYDEIGQRVGKNRSTVANAVRLLQLPPSIQKMVNERSLTAGHARALLALELVELQEQLAQRIVDEELSVRATEEAVRLAHELPPDPEPVASATAASRPPGLYDLEELLGEYLDTRVQISLGGRQRGKISISFAGYEDLERLCQVIIEGREEDE